MIKFFINIRYISTLTLFIIISGCYVNQAEQNEYVASLDLNNDGKIDICYI